MPVNSQKGATFLRESPKVQKCVKENDYFGKKCLSADFTRLADDEVGLRQIINFWRSRGRGR